MGCENSFGIWGAGGQFCQVRTLVRLFLHQESGLIKDNSVDCNRGNTLGAGVAQWSAMAVARHLSGMDSRVGTRGKPAIRAPKGALLIQLSKAGPSLLVTHLEAAPEATQACPGPPSLTKGIVCYSSSGK